MAFQIDAGHHGETSLDGLKFALVIRSAASCGGRQLAVTVVDGTANDAQRRALAAITSGEAGGPSPHSSATPSQRFSRCRLQADHVHDGGATPRGDHPDIRIRDRGRCIAQPQRGAILHRQHSTSGKPPPGTGSCQGGPFPIWPRPRSCGEGEQRSLLRRSPGRRNHYTREHRRCQSMSTRSSNWPAHPRRASARPSTCDRRLPLRSAHSVVRGDKRPWPHRGRQGVANLLCDHQGRVPSGGIGSVKPEQWVLLRSSHPADSNVTRHPA